MTIKTWCFSSTIEDFDGHRIVREAEACGAVVLRVVRDGVLREYIHESLHRRAAKVGFHLYRSLPDCFEYIPLLYHGVISDFYVPKSSWCRVPEGVSALDLYEQLKTFEARTALTTVQIITEEGG